MQLTLEANVTTREQAIFALREAIDKIERDMKTGRELPSGASGSGGGMNFKFLLELDHP